MLPVIIMAWLRNSRRDSRPVRNPSRSRLISAILPSVFPPVLWLNLRFQSAVFLAVSGLIVKISCNIEVISIRLFSNTL
jgi:hypothetical protein